MPEDPLAVQIGAREIYDKVSDVDRKVDRLADAHDGFRADLADHETRIRGLERGRWPLPSLAAVTGVGALAIALIDLLGKGK